jgi:hypothetical protein
MIDEEPFDLDRIKQRALVRDRWRVGRIGDPVAWCRFCQVKLPGETMQEHESVLHADGCSVPEANSRRQPDFDALLAEVERLRARYEPS